MGALEGVRVRSVGSRVPLVGSYVKPGTVGLRDGASDALVGSRLPRVGSYVKPGTVGLREGVRDGFLLRFVGSCVPRVGS